jgi:hypothetical protein
MSDKLTDKEIEELRAKKKAIHDELYDEVPCKSHPDAPHGFNRNSSHTLGRYVCDCEGWEPDE